MSEEQSEDQSYLEQALTMTSQTPADDTKALLATLTEESFKGTVTWDKNLTVTVDNAISAIDELISKQLTEVMHNEEFQRLEGSWTGVQKVVKESDLGPDLKIRIVDYKQDELLDQFEDAVSIDRSRFFDMVYQEEYGTAGGEPISLLLGDYFFSYSDEDVALLRYIGEVSAASHAPFIAATNPAMFDFPTFETFYEGKPVAAGFDSPSYASWNAFRESEDSRYVTLTMPQTMARMPYGERGTKVKDFNYQEFELDDKGEPRPSGLQDFTWTNACYEMGLLMTTAFRQSGWCTAIRGVDNGGKVENLPNYTYLSLSGDTIQQCPTQITITDEREKELSDLGFLPVVHFKGSNYGVFMGAQTTQKPNTYIDPDATANAAISARLPYIMASSRIAHYLKVMGRDRIGSALDPIDVEKELTLWIGQYVNPNAIGNESKAKTPLKEAKVTVVEQVGRPGCYSAVAYLCPWLQMEELTTSLRMVAKIPD